MALRLMPSTMVSGGALSAARCSKVAHFGPFNSCLVLFGHNFKAFPVEFDIHFFFFSRGTKLLKIDESEKSVIS